MILPFLGRLSFETRNKLNRCIRNQLPFRLMRIAFQLKTHLSSLFKFKTSIIKYLCSHLIHKFSCSCCNTTYYGETERHLFVRASGHLEITSMTESGLAIQKSLPLWTIFIIKRDKTEPNRNIYNHPLELFA